MTDGHNELMLPASRPRRRDDILVQGAGDTLILLTPDSGDYFTLNDVGGRIWELADGTRTVTEIAQTLSDEYEAPPEVIEPDALEVLTELAEAGLLDGEASR